MKVFFISILFFFSTSFSYACNELESKLRNLEMNPPTRRQALSNLSASQKSTAIAHAGNLGYLQAQGLMTNQPTTGLIDTLVDREYNDLIVEHNAKIKSLKRRLKWRKCF